MTILILAQRYENYAEDTEIHQLWKEKGGEEFSIEMSLSELDRYYYYSEPFEKIVTEILAKKSNNFVKYELVKHELKSYKPEDITDEFKRKFWEFEKEFEKKAG